MEDIFLKLRIIKHLEVKDVIQDKENYPSIFGERNPEQRKQKHQLQGINHAPNVL
jgi:hypothetical protein